MNAVLERNSLQVCLVNTASDECCVGKEQSTSLSDERCDGKALTLVVVCGDTDRGLHVAAFFVRGGVARAGHFARESRFIWNNHQPCVLLSSSCQMFPQSKELKASIHSAGTPSISLVMNVFFDYSKQGHSCYSLSISLYVTLGQVFFSPFQN